MQKAIRERLSGYGFPATNSYDPDLYGITPYTWSTIEKPLRVRLKALYTRGGNDVIESMGAAPCPPIRQDRLVLVVHQSGKRLQEATVTFRSKRLPGVSAVALISGSFPVCTQRYLDYFKDRARGGGFTYSSGGELDYRDPKGGFVLPSAPVRF